MLRSNVARVTRLAFSESLPEVDRIELFTLAVDWETKDAPNKPVPEQMSKDRFLLRSFDGSIILRTNDRGYSIAFIASAIALMVGLSQVWSATQ